MDKYQITVPIPTQGVNYADDSLIADNEAAEGTINISFREGQPQTRKGYAKQTLFSHVGEATPITKLAFHSVATKDRLLFASDKRLYQFNSDLTPILRSLGVIGSHKPNFLPIACALSASYPYTDKVLMADGIRFKWFDETHGLTDIPPYEPNLNEVNAYGVNVLSSAAHEIHGQKFILNDDNRVWLGGYGGMVRISHLGTAGAMPDYWPSSQVFRLPSDCTGMARFMGEVILFTESEAFLISGSTPIFSMQGNYVNTALPGGYGCSQHDSIAIGNNAIYWANKRGVYRYRYLPSGFSIPECVSEFITLDGRSRTIRPEIDKITDWSKVFATFVNHEYRLYTGNGIVMVYDTISQTWTKYEYASSFNCGVEHNHSLYYGGATVGTDAKYWIYQMDKGLSDDGASFDAVLLSKVLDFEKAANRKRFRRLYFSLYSEFIDYNIDLTYTIDGEPATIQNAFWSGTSPDQKATNLNFPIKLKHRKKRYNLQYQLKSTGGAWLLLNVVLMLKIKELR